MGDNHKQSEFRRVKPCWTCKSNGHHVSIRPTATTASGSKTSCHLVCNPAEPDGEEERPAILMMGLVDYQERKVTARLLFDGGSTASFITADLARRLGLEIKTGSYVSVDRVGNRKAMTVPRQMAVLPIPLLDGTILNDKVYVLDCLTSNVPKFPLDPDKHPELRHLPLADQLGKGVDGRIGYFDRW